MKITLYRAAKDDYVDTGYSFATEKSIAEAYLDNPGFGGSNLYRTKISATDEQIIDLTDASTEELAERFDVSDPGAIGVDEWLPRDPELLAAIRADGFLWAIVHESFPEETNTWIWCGTFEDGEPQLKQIDTLKEAPMARTAKKQATNTERAEQAGEQYAQDQLTGDYFTDWVRDQLLEASKMPPDKVLPLETKADALVIAKNMLQQLGWDAKRDLKTGDISRMIGSADDRKFNVIDSFWGGFDRSLESSRDWLADELLELKSEMGGGGRVSEAKKGSSRQAYRPSKNWRLHKVDRIVPMHGTQQVEFNDGLAVQVHSGNGRSDLLYAMKPMDTRYEGRQPGPESRREYQYAALVAVLDGKAAKFFTDHDGDVIAIRADGGLGEARRTGGTRGGPARKYYVVDQVQSGLWVEVGHFAARSAAERFQSGLAGRTRIKYTYPSTSHPLTPGRPAGGPRTSLHPGLRETDSDYTVQGLYSDGTISTERGFEDEDKAIASAKKMVGASWFEGDYTWVITRDGELVFDSRKKGSGPLPGGTKGWHPLRGTTRPKAARSARASRR